MSYKMRKVKVGSSHIDLFFIWYCFISHKGTEKLNLGKSKDVTEMRQTVS